MFDQSMVFLREGHSLYIYRNYTFVSMIFLKPYVILYIHIHCNIVIVLTGLYQIFEKNMFLIEANYTFIFDNCVFSAFCCTMKYTNMMKKYI